MTETTQSLYLPNHKVAAIQDSRLADYIGALVPLGLGNAAVGAIRGDGNVNEEGEKRTLEGGLKGWLGGLGGRVAGGVAGGALGGLAGLGLGGTVGGGASALSGAGLVGAIPGGATGGYGGLLLGSIIGSILGGAEGGRYFTRDLIKDKEEQAEA